MNAAHAVALADAPHRSDAWRDAIRDHLIDSACRRWRIDARGDEQANAVRRWLRRDPRVIAAMRSLGSAIELGTPAMLSLAFDLFEALRASVIDHDARATNLAN